MESGSKQKASSRVRVAVKAPTDPPELSTPWNSHMTSGVSDTKGLNHFEQ